MSRQRASRLLALVLILAGGLSALSRPDRSHLFGPSAVDRSVDRVKKRSERLPGWAMRVAGALGALLGFLLLSRNPFTVEEIYRAVASPYSAIDTRWRKWLYVDAHRAFDQLLAEMLSAGGDVLDLACGTGANLGRILDLKVHFESYVGVDLSSAMLREARRKYRDVARAKFVEMDLYRDPLPKREFDLVISTWALEHFKQPEHIVEKACERVRPGGSMLLLFEIEGHNLLSALPRMLYPLISTWPVEIWRVDSFPGVVELRRFKGPLGDLALVLLRKPIQAQREVAGGVGPIRRRIRSALFGRGR